MRHCMSKDTAFNGETTPRHTFLCSDSQCLPPGDPIILCAKHGSPITGKSFIGFTPFFELLFLLLAEMPYAVSIPISISIYCQMDLLRPTIFFSAKNSKVTIIKTKSATIAFLLLLLSFFSLFLFPLSFSFVNWFSELLGLKKPPFDTFALKWQSLQISLGWFSKKWFDIYPVIRPPSLVLDYCSLFLHLCEGQR